MNKVMDYIRETIDKETPIQPFDQYVIGWEMGKAGTCICTEIVNDRQDYCVNCGQKLDWGVE